MRTRPCTGLRQDGKGCKKGRGRFGEGMVGWGGGWKIGEEGGGDMGGGGKWGGEERGKVQVSLSPLPLHVPAPLFLGTFC